MEKQKTNDDEEDDEPDYMSDDFLAKCVPKDVRPSLLYHPGNKRKHDLLKKQKEANEATRSKPVRVQQQESRDAGLQKPIGTENKGFKLLEKMGYKPGTVIGKNSHDSTALKEPIQLEVKQDRVGLGKKTEIKEQLIKYEERKADFEKLADPNQFRSRIQAAAIQKVFFKDLGKAQSACRTLDSKNNVEEPVETWYWPIVEKVKNIEQTEEDEDDGQKPSKQAKVVELEESDEDEEEILTPEKIQQQLQAVTKYLREKYLYCIWCGTSYDTKDEYNESCPGTTKDDH